MSTAPKTRGDMEKVATLSPNSSDGGSLDGTQAIRRAVAILRMVASFRRPGASLNDICSAMNLPRSTTHRILKCLVSEGLLDNSDNDHRYVVGQLPYELSLSGLQDHHSAAHWSELVARIARVTGQTTYLMARTGGEAVCLQKAEGHALLRASPVDVGQRRPLGVGAGAIALLSAFEQDEIENYAKQAAHQLRSHKHLSPETVVADALAAKSRGYAVSIGRVFQDVAGIGINLPDAGLPSLAVSVTIPVSFLEVRSTEEIAAEMLREIAAT